MSGRDNFITYDKLLEYKRELQELKTVKRMEIAQKLKAARGWEIFQSTLSMTR